MERNIALVKDACSKPLITIRFHDLHASDIRGAVGGITSYHKRDSLSPFFGSYELHVFWPFFCFPFCLSCDGFGHQVFYWIFFCLPSYIDVCFNFLK